MPIRKTIIFLGLIFAFVSKGFCGTISIEALSSDAGVSYGWLNSAMTTITGVINGGIDADNIEDGTIADADFATATKMENWFTESIGNYTYTGHLPATDATLTSNISAGTSYVEGQRQVTNATSKTYTASKDTWVYIDKNGSFQYEEVANGGSQPTTPTDSLLLAKVVTDADNITSVTDHRQTTPPNLRVYNDLKNGLVISRDNATATDVNIGRGEIEFGTGVTSGLRRNTGTVTVDVTTTGRGGLDTGSLAQGYYYVFAVADDDNTTNYEGIASTSKTDASGVTGERLVGWFYAPTASAISTDSIGAYRGRGGDAPNFVILRGNDNITTASTTHSVMPGMQARFYSSGRPIKVKFQAPFSNSATAGYWAEVSISIDSVGYAGTRYDEGDNGEGFVHLEDIAYLHEGEHTIEVKWNSNDGAMTVSQNGATDGERRLIIEEY